MYRKSISKYRSCAKYTSIRFLKSILKPKCGVHNLHKCTNYIYMCFYGNWSFIHFFSACLGNMYNVTHLYFPCQNSTNSLNFNNFPFLQYHQGICCLYQTVHHGQWNSSPGVCSHSSSDRMAPSLYISSSRSTCSLALLLSVTITSCLLSSLSVMVSIYSEPVEPFLSMTGRGLIGSWH